MPNNKHNKHKNNKLYNITTIQSTTTKYRTIDEESFSPTLKSTAIRPNLRQQNSKKKSTSSKASHKSKTKINSKVKKVGNMCLKLQRNDSCSLLSTQLLSTRKANSITLKPPSIGKSTMNIINNMQQHQPPSHQPSSEIISYKYSQLLQQVLRRPHNCPIINFEGQDQTDSDVKWLYEVESYKQEQNRNWRQINKLLSDYVNGADPEDEEILKIQLQQQGRKNYRWLQMEDKASQHQFKIMESLIDGDLKQPEYDEVLPSYNWQRYIWNQSDSSKGQSQSVNQLIHVDLTEEEQVEEQVDLILNWLIDEHVLQVVQNIQILTQFKHIRTISTPFIERELDLDRIELCSNFYSEIDAITQKREQRVCQEIRDAFGQVKERTQVKDSSEVGRMLKKLLLERKDVDEVIPFVSKEQESEMKAFAGEVLWELGEQLLRMEIHQILIFLNRH